MNKDEALTIDVIIKILRERYGYDFSGYAKSSFIRRLQYHQKEKGLPSLEDIIPFLLKDSHAFDDLLSDISITVTEFFRDPHFYKAFADLVVPKLKTYPYIKLWHAGCATGEEIYSMAILLHENGFLDKSLIYGTDFNKSALDIAKSGVYPENKVSLYNNNYIKAMGRDSLQEYFTKKYQFLKVKKFLQEKVVLSHHNLSTDSSFGEVEVIVCRNVLIYFDDNLRDKVIKLFLQSLSPQGFLVLGDRESLETSQYQSHFNPIKVDASIYQRRIR